MASPETSIGATELVGAVVSEALPSDWGCVYLGGFPTSRVPDRAVAVSPAGGALPLSWAFGRARPLMVRGRVKVLIRDTNRDGSDNWDWMRQTASRIASRLDSVQATREIAVDETLSLSPDVSVEVRSTFPRDVFIRVSQPPSFVQYGTPGAGPEGPRLNIIELAAEVAWWTERIRPATAGLGPWDPLRFEVPSAPRVVRSVAVAPSGGPGRVLAGGQFTARAVPRMLPADPRFPPSVGPGSVPHGAPIDPPRSDGLLWVNANIPTRSSRGELDIFAQGSGNVVTATRGLGGGAVRIDGAHVLTAPTMRLRVEVSSWFDAAAERDWALLLQDHAKPPAQYVFRLADATRAVVSGDETYTFDWAPETPPKTSDQWDWSAVDLTRFRLAAAPSRPAPGAPFRIRYALRWSDGEAVGHHDADAGGGAVILPVFAANRPAGGTLEQLVSVSTAVQPARGQEFDVLFEGVEGCVVFGEQAVGSPDPQQAPAAGGSPFHPGFSSGFGSG